MNTRFINCNIDWLTDENAQSAQHDINNGQAWHEVPMPDGSTGGHIEVLPLNLGLIVSRGVHPAPAEPMEQMFPLGEITSELAETSLVIQSARSGRVMVQDRITEKEYFFDKDTTLFQCADHLRFSPLLEMKEDVVVTMLTGSLSVLKQLVGAEVIDAIMDNIGFAELPDACSQLVPESISSILHSSISGNLKDELRVLYAQARVMEYLSTIVVHLLPEFTASPISKKEKMTFELREELVQMEGKVPKLADLAERFGVSAKTLNESFKESFGMPIYSFVIEYRLNQAHIALAQSDTPIKVIAYRVGYSHVNHFISAFSKRFGNSPAKLRRLSR